METLTGLAVFLTCAFIYLAGWWTCLKFRYEIEHWFRAWKYKLQQAWRALRTPPDPHTPYARKRILERLRKL